MIDITKERMTLLKNIGGDGQWFERGAVVNGADHTASEIEAARFERQRFGSIVDPQPTPAVWPFHPGTVTAIERITPCWWFSGAR